MDKPVGGAGGDEEEAKEPGTFGDQVDDAYESWTLQFVEDRLQEIYSEEPCMIGSAETIRGMSSIARNTLWNEHLEGAHCLFERIC